MNEKIGIFDTEFKNPNPLNSKPYSEKYKSIIINAFKYPTYKKAIEILEKLDKSQILIIKASTGTGKTFWIPKIALHYLSYGKNRINKGNGVSGLLNNETNGKIAVTLPKRIIAERNASYGAESLDVELGTQVGVKFRNSPKKYISNDSVLVYMTDGTLIQTIINREIPYSIVIIDEAHERKIPIDELLLLIKTSIENGAKTKLIIMSATIDTQKYKEFFERDNSGLKISTVEIEGSTSYPINVVYLDKPTTSYINEGLKIINDLLYSYNNQINNNNNYILKVTKDQWKPDGENDVLFFVTSGLEASQICKEINKKYNDVFCLEIYKDMSINFNKYVETSEAFKNIKNKSGNPFTRRLLSATNVVESSLTPVGISFVIDCGKEIFQSFDPLLNCNVLQRKWITKAQALQRRGRVGRTKQGTVFNLYTLDEESKMAEYPEPDILKNDITMDILKLATFTGNNKVQKTIDYMNSLMDKPTQEYLSYSDTLFSMYKIQRIDSETNEKLWTKQLDILSKFTSLSLNRALFIIYSKLLNVQKYACIIVAMIDQFKVFFGGNTIIENEILSSKNLNESKKQNNEPKKQNKLNKEEWLNTNNKFSKLFHISGDHLSLLNIFNDWKKSKDRNKWCKKYEIYPEIMRTVQKMSEKYKAAINSFDIPSLIEKQQNKKDKQTKKEKQNKLDENTKSKLITSLIVSHLHLRTKNNKTLIFNSNRSLEWKDLKGKINTDSSIRKIPDSYDIIFDRQSIIFNSTPYYEIVTIIPSSIENISVISSLFTKTINDSV